MERAGNREEKGMSGAAARTGIRKKQNKNK